MNILGLSIQIVESALCVQQYRFPKSKKKRIRKKWAARSINFKPSPTGFKVGNTIYCHPQFARRLRTELANV